MRIKILILILSISLINAQAGWIKTFGADEEDGSSHVLQLEDGYLITGFTKSFGNGGKDLWIVRTDKSRKELWNRFYGGMLMDTGTEAIETDDNGFIILAQTYSYGAGLSDIWIIKIDSVGKILWDKTIGTERVDIGYDICKSNEGGYVIAGMTVSEKTNSPDGYIVKIDSIGNTIWSQIYGGLDIDAFHSISAIDNEYGYITVGQTKSYMLDKSRIKNPGFFGRIIASILKKKPTSEVWIMNIDEYGDKNWHNTYGGKKDDVGKSIKQSGDGGYIITSETSSMGAGKNDIWVIKVDKNGKIKWDITIGDKKDEFASSTTVSKRQEIFISGYKTKKEKFSLRKLIKPNKNIEKNNKQRVSGFLVMLDKKGKIKWELDPVDESNNLGSFLETTKNGVLITGQKSTEFNGSGDMWLISASKKGKVRWQETYGGRGTDGGNYTLNTSDGGYVMVGYTDAYGHGKNDIWVIKTDFTGEKEWSGVYGGKSDDYGWGITETKDNGFVIAGETFSYGNGQSDVYIIKVDSSGNKLWENTFGGIAEDVGYSIANTNDGGYLVASQTRSYGKGGSDGMLIKFNSDGGKEWEKVYGGKGLDYFRSIISDSLNGFIISGGTRSFSDGDSQAWVLCVDDNGYVKWENTYGDNGEDGFNMIQQTIKNGYIAVGHSSSFFSTGKNDAFMVRIDSLGNKIWQSYIGGKEDDRGYAISQCSDGGYILTGETSSFGNGKNDILVVKTNSIGKQKWRKTFGGSGVDIGRSIKELPNGGFILTGTSTISNLSFDAIMIKTDKSGKSGVYNN